MNVSVTPLDSETVSRKLHRAAIESADGVASARETRQELIKLIVDGLLDDDSDRQASARETTSLLISRAHRFAESTLSDHASERAAKILIYLEDDLGALERALNINEGRAPRTDESQVSSDIQWVRSQIRECLVHPNFSSERASLKTRTRVMSDEFALSQAERLVLRPLDSMELEDLERHLAQITTVRSLLKESNSGSESRDLLRELNEVQGKVREGIHSRLESSSARDVELKALAIRLVDRLDDRLSLLETYSLSATVRLCGDEIDDIDWIRPKLSKNPEFRWIHKKLRHRRKRLLDEIEERRVQQRLERRWGRRSLAALEALVLVLILAVVGILLIQALFELPHEWNRAILAIDASICAVFLIEYFIKAFASPTSWRYARRHFILDFLPSIPFDLILQVSGFGIARSARAVRLVRLPRFVRYLRAARPLVRLVRVVGFLLRGMDRLVRRHAALINVNVVLFEEDPLPKSEQDSPLSPKLGRVTRRCRGQLSHLLKRLGPEEQLRVLRTRMDVAQRSLDDFASGSHKPIKMRVMDRDAREVTFPALIESLSGLDSTQVRGHLDVDSAEKLRMVLRYGSLPVLRKFPIIGALGRGTSEMDAFEATAHAGRVVGGWLKSVLQMSRAIGDLWGVVTAPRLLDRFGGALAKATRRPAYRLLIFGIAFLLLQGFIAALQLDGLEKITLFLSRLLGTPILILGGVCLALHHLGRWLQKLAGEATDTFRKISEAQFINLLSERKRSRTHEDLKILYARVLTHSSDDRDLSAGALSLQRHISLDPKNVDAQKLSLQELLAWGEFETVKLLYHDYLDGSVLHQSNHKTSEQLLGNLSLQHIRDERMRVSAKERHRLSKLDLSQRVAFSLGPNLWFYSITSSLAEQTAKLILDYNRNAIPKTAYHQCTPSDLAGFRKWLGQSREQIPSTMMVDDETLSEIAENTRTLRTTQFHALHFLSRDERREALVTAEFGEGVSKRLGRDRRAMIRYVFGHYPYGTIPKPDRTINPYDLYWDYIGGGRALLLPLVSIYAFFRILFRLLSLGVRTVKGLLNPEDHDLLLEKATTTIEVARRKIARMRHPIFMECLTLRAAFDPEFLGCSLPLVGEAPRTISTVEQDLLQIGALDSERHTIEARRGKSQARLDKLSRWLSKNGYDLDAIATLIQKKADQAPNAESHWIAREPSESVRALSTAYAMDYEGIATKLTLRDDLRALFEEAIRNEGAAQSVTGSRPPRWWERLPVFSPKLRRGFSIAMEELGTQWTKTQQRHCHLFLVQDIRRMRSRLTALSQYDSIDSAEQSAREVLDSILLHPLPWRRQLVTARTLQTLSYFDLRDDRHAVSELAQLGPLDTETAPIHE